MTGRSVPEHLALREMEEGRGAVAVPSATVQTWVPLVVRGRRAATRHRPAALPEWPFGLWEKSRDPLEP
jgi:hypothetical protein